MVEGAVELVDGLGPEGVTDLGSVERHPHGWLCHRPVVGDVLELEPLDWAPGIGVEQLGDNGHDTNVYLPGAYAARPRRGRCGA